MITVSLFGGLGNQLFQLAALDSISKQTTRNVYVESFTSPQTGHSEKKYFDSIFSRWHVYPEKQLQCERVDETSYKFREWKFAHPIVKLHGYFQNYKYIADDFIDKLWFPDTGVCNGAFLHIRGGDFVNNPFHHFDLNLYYTKAIALFPKNTRFFIFTNDIPYAKTFQFLDTIDYEFVNETDELVSLSMMKNCTLGGICANSTFSWWGAYLNRNNRTLVLPSKWFNTSDIYIEGYFFPGSTICPV